MHRPHAGEHASTSGAATSTPSKETRQKAAALLAVEQSRPDNTKLQAIGLSGPRQLTSGQFMLQQQLLLVGTDIEQQIGLAPSAHVLMSAVSSTRPTQVHEQYFSTTRWNTKTPVFRQCLHGRDAHRLTAALSHNHSWPQVIK